MCAFHTFSRTGTATDMALSHQEKRLNKRFLFHFEPPYVLNHIIVEDPGGFNVEKESFVEAFSSMDTHILVFFAISCTECYLSVACLHARNNARPVR